VRDVSGVVVGLISADLEIEGYERCDQNAQVRLKEVETGAYVIFNGSQKVGTAADHLPR
jgi:hypothetical protein